MVTREQLVIRKHAAEHMASDAISVDDVLDVLNTGTVVREYPDDTPFPSSLMLGFPTTANPVHVVSAIDPTLNLVYIITAYRPDPALWQEGFTRRKR